MRERRGPLRISRLSDTLAACFGGDPLAVAKDTPLPPEATHLLVFTANAEGENPTPKAIALRDDFFEERTLAIGAAPLELRMPSAAIDAKNALRHRLRVQGRRRIGAGEYSAGTPWRWSTGRIRSCSS